MKRGPNTLQTWIGAGGSARDVANIVLKSTQASLPAIEWKDCDTDRLVLIPNLPGKLRQRELEATGEQLTKEAGRTAPMELERINPPAVLN